MYKSQQTEAQTDVTHNCVGAGHPSARAEDDVLTLLFHVSSDSDHRLYRPVTCPETT